MDEFNSSEPPLNISGVFENGQDAMSDPTTLHSSQFTSFEVDSATIIPSGGEPSTGVGNLHQLYHRLGKFQIQSDVVGSGNMVSNFRFPI